MRWLPYGAWPPPKPPDEPILAVLEEFRRRWPLTPRERMRMRSFETQLEVSTVLELPEVRGPGRYPPPPPPPPTPPAACRSCRRRRRTARRWSHDALKGKLLTSSQLSG